MKFLLDLFSRRPPVRPRRPQSPPRKEARRVILTRVDHWSRLMGVRFNAVRVKDTRSRWGSCSVKRNLNFNWRLIRAPLPVLDYVVIHELAHLVEMNHSKRFWAVVALWCPGHKALRKWLRENGRALLNGGQTPRQHCPVAGGSDPGIN